MLPLKGDTSHAVSGSMGIPMSKSNHWAIMTFPIRTIVINHVQISSITLHIVFVV